MSKAYLTQKQALAKVGSSGGGNSFCTKFWLMQQGKFLDSKYNAYRNTDFVIDDDIVAKAVTSPSRTCYIAFYSYTIQETELNNILKHYEIEIMDVVTSGECTISVGNKFNCGQGAIAFTATPDTEIWFSMKPVIGAQYYNIEILTTSPLIIMDDATPVCTIFVQYA